MNPRYITNAKGKQTDVVLTMKEFNELLEAYEDLEDIKSYNEAKERMANGESEIISLEQMKAELRTLGKLDYNVFNRI
jgi:predicted DNA-binding protein